METLKREPVFHRRCIQFSAAGWTCQWGCLKVPTIQCGVWSNRFEIHQCSVDTIVSDQLRKDQFSQEKSTQRKIRWNVDWALNTQYGWRRQNIQQSSWPWQRQGGKVAVVSSVRGRWWKQKEMPLKKGKGRNSVKLVERAGVGGPCLSFIWSGII